MKILLAVDGSESTRKAVAYLVTHTALLEGGEVVILHVRPHLPPRVEGFVSHASVSEYHEEEANKVLAPVESFVRKHGIACRTKWVVGRPAHEIVQASLHEQARLIVMGVHGHGFFERALMGSTAQGVVAHTEVPVLLVK